ncbi:MAG: glycoside hydrolase family 78 protein [Clostridiales bacterium]|nr:glycoside hydrolase family 78 protein [Clostridiales bacterium]
MRATRLKTEYLFNPIGIDIKRPRMMWNCEGGTTQTAYEIIAGEWQSGKVKSSSMHTEYPKELTSRQRISWRIRLWDENDEPGEWSEAYFEMGLLEPSDWKADWITGNYSVNKKERYPVDCFKKDFRVEKTVKKARLYITSCGLYEARLGGEKIGDFCLAPGLTDYRKRIQYQTYDITDYLREGDNTISVQLADGWYRGSCGAWGIRNQYGTETKFIAQIEIECTDDTIETIGSDDSWKWSDDGPIRFADNKDGETVEAFRTPTYLKNAKKTTHNVVPTSSNNVQVTEHEHFHPVISKAPNGKILLDFGQNMAGYVSFRINASVGKKMVWTFGELLDKEGNLSQKNIQLSTKKKTTPLQKIDYTCGEGINEYKTTFAIFGFRYAQVETDIEVNAEDIQAIAVYSDMENTGSFISSNQLLNSFVNATRWSAKSNHLDIPTDCPTRERHGWTGDAQIFCGTASYLFDYMSFAKKYLNDVYDWQKKNGKLPQIAPEGGTDFYMKAMDGCIGWADAGVIIPYTMWKKYNDRRIIELFWPGMQKYASFMQSHCGKLYPTAKHVTISSKDRKYLNNYGQAYGEWAEPQDVNPQTWKTCVVTHPETATAYTCYIMTLMSEIAEELGKKQEAEGYRQFADNNKKSYQALMRSKEYSLDTDRQAQLVRALYFGLLDDEQSEYAKTRLIKALDNYGWRLGTGFLSTPLILDVLVKIGTENAYRLLENEEIPGWLSMPKNGATTIWEAWEGPNTENGGIGSLNHYSKGAVVEWLFKTMCGINVDGENHFSIAPNPGGHFTYAEASYMSIFGEVCSSWKRVDGKTVYSITIPSNTTANVKLPDGSERTQMPGTAEYEIKDSI